jgi:hypothetical protein
MAGNKANTKPLTNTDTGRGLWPPARYGEVWRCGRGDGSCHCSGDSAFASAGGTGKRGAFPPPARDSALQTGRPGTSRRPAPDPAGAKRPPGAGRALAGGFCPRLVLIPAWRRCRGDGPCRDAQGARRQVFPALRSGSRCGRHVFSTLPRPGHSCPFSGDARDGKVSLQWRRVTRWTRQ